MCFFIASSKTRRSKPSFWWVTTRLQYSHLRHCSLALTHRLVLNNRSIICVKNIHHVARICNQYIHVLQPCQTKMIAWYCEKDMDTVYYISDKNTFVWRDNFFSWVLKMFIVPHTRYMMYRLTPIRVHYIWNEYFFTQLCLLLARVRVSYIVYVFKNICATRKGVLSASSHIKWVFHAAISDLSSYLTRQ